MNIGMAIIGVAVFLSSLIVFLRSTKVQGVGEQPSTSKAYRNAILCLLAAVAGLMLTFVGLLQAFRG